MLELIECAGNMALGQPDGQVFAYLLKVPLTMRVSPGVVKPPSELPMMTGHVRCFRTRCLPPSGLPTTSNSSPAKRG